MLRTGPYFSRLPRRAPELSTGIARSPVESEEHRKQAATGSPFLWLLSFGDAKESNSPSGATNPIQIAVAVATP
ncbi:MAG: hypothetical protein ACXV8Q_08475 [Methylobacter sp.]